MFVYLDHITKESPEFKRGEVKYAQAFFIGHIFADRHESCGASLYTLDQINIFSKFR